MKRVWLQLATALFTATLLFPATPADTKTTRKKKYKSSAGNPGSSAQKTASAKPRRRLIPKGPPVSAKTRAEAHQGVFAKIANGADIPIENSAALVPFFELLYRHQKGELTGPVRILHYGDSHTAADEWTGDLRTRFQEKFGDGGSGYSFAGRPWNSYRRLDVRTGSTRGWHTDGLVGRSGDGAYGLGGISLSTVSAHEAIYLDANAAEFELFYYQQPGGGTLQIYDNGAPTEQISTDGEPRPAYYHLEATPGMHRVEAETLDRSPVRLFGWVAENTTGVTYEELGINGAEASIILGWNEDTLRSNIERRNPALIVLAYGTNEAGRKDWTLESYREMYSNLIARLRADAPTATILVVGPADRTQKVRKSGRQTPWETMEKIDVIAEAQRQAALANGCAFWN